VRIFCTVSVAEAFELHPNDESVAKRAAAATTEKVTLKERMKDLPWWVLRWEDVTRFAEVDDEGDLISP
jgi:hypothetical protein